MQLLINADAVDVSMAQLRSEVRKASTLQEAAQRLMDRFRVDFAESVVLARTYATVPYRLLPARDRDFVHSAVETGNMADSLGRETRVLSLLGTAGVEPAWCDRYGSRNHLGIPLFSEDAITEIPMVAALIRELGSTASWFEKRSPPTQSAEGFGVFTGSFFVEDPAHARDETGRLLIPAQEFVETYNIKTVFGVGGEFLASRTILVCIFFSSERLEQTPPWLLRLPLMLATATRSLVLEGNIF